MPVKGHGRHAQEKLLVSTTQVTVGSAVYV